jgi:hypothetical protein
MQRAERIEKRKRTAHVVEASIHRVNAEEALVNGVGIECRSPPKTAEIGFMGPGAG